MRMQDLGLGDTAFSERPETLPRQAVPLTAPSQRAQPMTQHLPSERLQRRHVAGDGVVVVVTPHHRPQPRDLLQQRLVTAPPPGWSTPSGGGLHLKATAEVDALGRPTKETDPLGHVDYTVYKDAAHEVRLYAGWDSGTNLPTGPTMLLREDRAGSYSEALTMTATPTVSGGRPTCGECVSGLERLVRGYAKAAGHVTDADRYFDLTVLSYSTATTRGAENTNYYRTRYAYDWRGRNSKVVTPTGTIYREVFDPLDRSVS